MSLEELELIETIAASIASSANEFTNPETEFLPDFCDG